MGPKWWRRKRTPEWNPHRANYEVARACVAATRERWRQMEERERQSVDALCVRLANSNGADPGLHADMTELLFKATLPSTVAFLLGNGVDIHAHSEDGTTALHRALGKHAAIVQLLLDASADPNARNESNQRTPLHDAVSGVNDPEVAWLLLSAGANPNAVDSEGQTPLHVACRCGHSRVVHALLVRGADPHIQDKRGRTPLHSAFSLIGSNVHTHTLYVIQALVLHGVTWDATCDAIARYDSVVRRLRTPMLVWARELATGEPVTAEEIAAINQRS